MQDLASNLITALEGETDEELRFLVPRFSRHIASEDVGSIGVPAIFGQVSRVRDLAAWRAAGTSKVAVWRDDDGLATVAAIVTDDMPFLVDSVTAALTDEGRSIRLVLHPQLVVERDPQGNLLQNVITEAQKQRAREIFELSSLGSGVRFVETPPYDYLKAP